MYVDLAEEQDLADVIKLCYDGVKELQEKQELPDANPDMVESAIREEHKYSPVFIVKSGDDIVGFAAMCRGRHFWSPELYLTTSMVYIKPEHRSHKAIRRLYDAIKKYAILQGVPYIDHYLCNGEIDGRRALVRSLKLKEYGIIIGY